MSFTVSTARARKGWRYPVGLRALKQALAPAGESARSGLRVRFANPNKTVSEGGLLVLELTSPVELIIFSMPGDIDGNVASGRVLSALGRLLALATNWKPKERVWESYVVYLDDELKQWRICRRTQAVTFVKYRGAQKFSSAFHPRLGKVMEKVIAEGK